MISNLPPYPLLSFCCWFDFGREFLFALVFLTSKSQNNFFSLFHDSLSFSIIFFWVHPLCTSKETKKPTSTGWSLSPCFKGFVQQKLSLQCIHCFLISHFATCSLILLFRTVSPCFGSTEMRASSNFLSLLEAILRTSTTLPHLIAVIPQSG